MSAQPSLLISTRLLSSEILEPSINNAESPEGAASTLSLDSPIVADLIPSDELVINADENHTTPASAIKTKQALKEVEAKLDQAEKTQLEDIEALQANIISDPEFDFSLLPSTAAGQNSSETSESTETTTSETFASNAYIETVNSETSTSLGERVDVQNTEPNTISSARQQIETNNEDQTDHTNRTLDTFNQSATEDIRYQVNGVVDSPYQLINTSHETEFGEITYSEDGSWQYTLNNSAEEIQSLGADNSLIESIELNSKSGDSFTLNITIYGVNDTATIAGDKEGEVLTLSNQSPGERPETIQGKLSVTDSDQEESSMMAEEGIQGTYGTVDISASGDWTYTLDSDSDAIKSLHSSDNLYDLIPVKTIDGTNQLLKITIHGADDSPFLSGDNAETINLANTLIAEQKLNIDDPDFGESRFIADDSITSRSNYGTGSIDEHGNWRFELDSANPKLASLGDNERLFDTFTVETADGTTQTIIITIEGNNDSILAVANIDDNHERLSQDELISLDSNTETQQTLDNFLGNTISEANHSNTATDSTPNNSAEILQELQINSHDSHVIS